MTAAAPGTPRRRRTRRAVDAGARHRRPASSAISTEPVTAAGSAGHVGAVAGSDVDDGALTAASSPASGDAPACQQMSSGSWSPGSPMSARNLSATGKGSSPTCCSRPASELVGRRTRRPRARTRCRRYAGRSPRRARAGRAGPRWADFPDDLAVPLLEGGARTAPGRAGGSPGGAAGATTATPPAARRGASAAEGAGRGRMSGGSSGRPCGGWAGWTGLIPRCGSCHRNLCVRQANGKGLKVGPDTHDGPAERCSAGPSRTCVEVRGVRRPRCASRSRWRGTSRRP